LEYEFYSSICYMYWECHNPHWLSIDWPYIYIHNPNYIPIYSIYQHNLSIIGSYWIPTDFHSMIFLSGRWLNHQAVLDDMNLRSSRRGRLFSMTLRVNHFGWLKNLCTTEVWNIWYLPHEIYKSIFLQKIYFCCCAYWIFLDV
jgi:hypothetical protein